MRVCHIWHNFYPIEFGGVERYILSLSNFLSNQDHRIQFLMITDKAAYVPLSRGLRTPRSQRINSLEVHRLGPNLSSFLRGTSYKLFHRSSKPLENMLAAQLYNEAARIKGLDKIDIFHVHGFWQNLYPTIGLLLSQHFHRPFVVTLHGDSINLNDPYAMPIRAQTTIDVLRRASAITTFSKETFNLLGEIGLDKKSWLVPNFIDTRYYKRPISNENGPGTRIVMVTRFSKPKDPLTPIRAFARVRKEVPEATFKIVGYGPLYEQARSLVRSLNLEEAVTMVGMKFDLRNFLWDSDIFIGTRGSYITTLEAWAAGLAVVAPEFGILKELVSNGKNGYLSPPGDIAKLTSVLIALIKNKQLRTKIAANGVLASEKHDISQVAPSIANIYKSIV
jgi:glycosyltransferase involved in cell wall biosynthesis